MDSHFSLFPKTTLKVIFYFDLVACLSLFILVVSVDGNCLNSNYLITVMTEEFVSTLSIVVAPSLM